MLVFDTDVLSLVQTGPNPEVERLLSRIQTSGDTACVTIVTLQEQFRGRLAQCTRATDPDLYVAAANHLRRTFEDYRGRDILDFDERAAAEFRRLRSLKLRVGTMDLRIAAIVLAHGATLISRNQSDFRKVPNLRVEDWTRPA